MTRKTFATTLCAVMLGTTGGLAVSSHLGFGSAAAAEKVKRTYSYVCRTEGCEEKGKVQTFEEITPKEHKCPKCKNRLSRAEN
jgi:rRNA maturation endonuclease Nob1